MLDKSEIYYMYLRKSREDRDAETHGEGETLARHEKRLNELAGQLGIEVSRIYREVVSGETIAARPEMMRLLTDIENHRPEGVLVVELERLARGDTRDQGLIMETFKYGNTKIITPMKTYDPNDEFDEEYAEFGLFMSRREYKVINRRLQNGRLASIREGKWTGNKAPYGYERMKLPHEKGFTLKILPEESKIVQFIFKLFTEGAPESDNLPLGTTQISHLLDDLKITPRSTDHWDACVIRGILRNYAYIGKIQAGKRKQIKTIENGVIKMSRPINPDCEIVNGIHPPIIDDHVFYTAQKKLDANFRPACFSTIKSPLAGLIYCNVCKRSMLRRPPGAKHPGDTLLCKTHDCPTVGSSYYLVEERLLQFLEEYLKDYKIRVQEEDSGDWAEVLDRKKAVLAGFQNDASSLRKQLESIYGYFEQQIYSLELFQKRSNEITRKIAENDNLIKQIKGELAEVEDHIRRKEEIIPCFEGILKSYHETANPLKKNALLRQIVDHVHYTKTKKGTRGGKWVDAFSLDVYLKLPYRRL